MTCRRSTVALLAILVLAANASRGAEQGRATTAGSASALGGRLELERQSEFSRIRVRRQGNVRSLIFVRDNGDEAIQSTVDLQKPYVLRFSYLRFLFTTYLVQPPPRKVMVVGLGGGSMVHFLSRIEPNLQVEAVEIDPAVVEIADKYFAVRPSETIHIVTADGLAHIAAVEAGRFDAIYLDAFLKPADQTDGTGAPLALRTRQFYKQLQTKLASHGVVAFNLNPHPQVEDDVAAIAEAFPQTYVFRLPRGEGLVVVGGVDAERLPQGELVRRAIELDRSGKFRGLLNFREMVRQLRP